MEAPLITLPRRHPNHPTLVGFELADEELTSYLPCTTPLSSRGRSFSSQENIKNLSPGSVEVVLEVPLRSGTQQGFTENSISIQMRKERQ